LKCGDGEKVFFFFERGKVEGALTEEEKGIKRLNKVKRTKEISQFEQICNENNLISTCCKQWSGLFLEPVLTVKCSITNDNKGNILDLNDCQQVVFHTCANYCTKIDCIQ